MREACAALAGHRPSLCCANARMPRQTCDWDCGYANTASMCATLTAGARPSLAARGLGGGGAAVAHIQRLVEGAWREGFDPESARQFGGSLAGKTGRAGWLGAPESLVLLWHVRAEAFIVEIVQRAEAGAAVYSVASACFAEAPADGADDASPGERAPKRQRCADGGVAPSPSAGGCTARAPLLLQHEGHSRTIVGVLPAPHERVILRDPKDAPRRLRIVPLSQLNGRQYQIVCAGRPTARDGATAAALTLNDERAASRLGRDPEPAAVLDRMGRWRHASWCGLRFG
jgi:hypothetical protein